MKIKEISEEYILFDNGNKIEYYHNQDCCERVYADFNSLKDTDIIDQNFNDIQIELVEDFGFRLNGFPVPCYNEQNGYYCDDLELIIIEGVKITHYKLNDYDMENKYLQDNIY